VNELEALGESVDFVFDELNALAAPSDREQPQAPLLGSRHHGIGLRVIDIDHGRAARLDEIGEQPQLGAKIMFKGRMIVEMITRDIGETCRRNMHTVEATLVEPVRRSLQGEMRHAFVCEFAQPSMKRDRIRRRERAVNLAQRGNNADCADARRLFTGRSPYLAGEGRDRCLAAGPRHRRDGPGLLSEKMRGREGQRPARIAVGLVYIHGAFYYHAWPEVYLEEGAGSSGLGARSGLWLPVDPTLNQFPADVTHLRLARGGLGEHLADASCSIVTRRAIPQILINIGTPAAAQVLQDNLLETNTALRFQVISALNKIQQVHPEIEIDKQLLETILAAEIMGHYRSYQILESLRAPGNTDDPVLRALGESIRQELERIFRLLGLLYPRLDLHSAYFGLQSKDPTVYDNALEFLETVLKSQLRGMLLPLLDGKVSLKERALIAERVVRAKVENGEQAVSELVASDDPWLKSCGAYAIGSLGLLTLEGELNRCLEHPDPLLRETARAAKIRLQGVAAKSRHAAAERNPLDSATASNALKS